MTTQTVNGLDEARAALARGDTALASPPFAACHAGIGYYEAMLEQLRTEYAETAFTFTLCCGDDPAMAHEALRRGFTSVRCATSPAMHEKLAAIALMGGGRLIAFDGDAGMGGCP